MENHSDLAKGLLKSGNARSTANSLWKRLAEDLNAAGPPMKDVVGWKKVWSDYKIHLKAKLRKNKNSLSETGGGPGRHVPLTSLEEQVQKLLSMEESIVGVRGAVSFGACLDEDGMVSGADGDKENTERNEEYASLISPRPSTSKRRSRPIKIAGGRDALLQKQVDGQVKYHQDCLKKLHEIHDDLKYIGRQYKKIVEIEALKLDLMRQKFLFKRKEASEQRMLLHRKLEIKKRLLEIELKNKRDKNQ